MAAVVLALATLAGCSGDGSAPSPSSSPATPSGAASSAGGAGGTGISPRNLPTAPALSDPQGAVADVQYGDCPVGAGKLKLSGTVKNTSRSQTDYVITMSWINDTSDVLGRGIAVVKDLDAGQTKDWTLSADVAKGATRCAPNVLRGSLKG